MTDGTDVKVAARTGPAWAGKAGAIVADRRQRFRRNVDEPPLSRPSVPPLSLDLSSSASASTPRSASDPAGLSALYDGDQGKTIGTEVRKGREGKPKARKNKT